MLTNINIIGFKAFENNNFDLNALTILTGLNGSGKTSLIQSLLLINESLKSEHSQTLELNGPYEMSLGVADLVKNWNCDSNIIFQFIDDAIGMSLVELESPSDDSMYLNIINKPNEKPVVFSGSPRTLTYISAERFGPRKLLPVSSKPASEVEVGVYGENCAQMLSMLGDRVLEFEDRKHPNSNAEDIYFLKYEVEKWLCDIARKIEIKTEYSSTNGFSNLLFKTKNGDWVTAPNMGFGLSYCLPIILAGLTTKRNGMIVVENPEAHLHPSGQSKMGEFLAWVASKGVQVILETHSDHIINGIRLAIGSKKFISNTDAVVHFFDYTKENEKLSQPLLFTEIGGIKDWPLGFFDQYQLDISELGQIRRNLTK
jgi:predicted ATPase